MLRCIDMTPKSQRLPNPTKDRSESQSTFFPLRHAVEAEDLSVWEFVPGEQVPRVVASFHGSRSKERPLVRFGRTIEPPLIERPRHRGRNRLKIAAPSDYSTLGYAEVTANCRAKNGSINDASEGPRHNRFLRRRHLPPD